MKRAEEEQSEARVPLLELTLQYQELEQEIRAAVTGVIEKQQFVLGPTVERFESEIAEYLGVEHAIGCASGTDALLLSLRALDIGPGDEVITSPFSFFATAGAIHNVGARPVFADILPDSFNLDPTAAEAAITGRTRAIIPVHLFGLMADMDAFRRLGDRRGLKIIEDGAQAIGAGQRTGTGEWMTTGTLGDACAFSFFPSKNLGGFGDGGLVVTHTEEVADRLRVLRVHGSRQTYLHEEVGYNSRLDALQAAVLLVKLPHLERWSEARRANARFYNDALSGMDGLSVPVISDQNRSIFNQYTIRVHGGRRDALMHHLRESRIVSAIYYPIPLHRQPCFAYLGYKSGALPTSELAVSEVLSLPVFPELRRDQLEYVVNAVRAFFSSSHLRRTDALRSSRA